MNRSIRKQASEWFVEFRTAEPSERVRRDFLAWLKESPAHMAAYLEMSAVWDESGSLQAREKWPLSALLEEARGADQNVVALGLPASSQSSARKLSRGWLRVTGIAASVLLVLAATVGLWFYSVRDTYVTSVGEQRSIVLSDGSTLELNSHTRVRVRFTDHERHVDLMDGQALFTVAKSRNWPFVVESGATRVRAVGTQFDIYRKSSGITVTVLEGSVAVTPETPAPRSQPALLQAGEQLTIGARSELRKVQIANPAVATAWTQRQLIFDNTRLQDVAEEFNRYNRRQLIIRDPGLRDYAIDGVFSSTDPASLVSFLRSRPGVTVQETGTEIIVDAR